MVKRGTSVRFASDIADGLDTVVAADPSRTRNWVIEAAVRDWVVAEAPELWHRVNLGESKQAALGLLVLERINTLRKAWTERAEELSGDPQLDLAKMTGLLASLLVEFEVLVNVVEADAERLAPTSARVLHAAAEGVGVHARSLFNLARDVSQGN